MATMLDGIARQTFASVPRPTMHVVIADNEGSELARQACEQFKCRSGLSLTYVHEPRRGISFARNAYLDNLPASFEFLISIDDDEVPDPDWLERLIEAQVATGADVVQGAVYPIFADGASKWLEDGQFFGRPRREWQGTIPQRTEYQGLDLAGTGNVLVRIAPIAALGLRFDPQLALTGGEDTMFFRSLIASGSRIIWAPRARVGEFIPPERATVWYRLKIEYRIGNNPLPQPVDPKKRKGLKRLRKRWVDSGTSKIVTGAGHLLAAAVARNRRKEKAMVAGLRIAFGLGQITRALGLTYSPYR